MGAVVCICGSRFIHDMPRLERAVEHALDLWAVAGDRPVIVEAVSGGAAGADALGEQYARERAIALRIFPADWSKLGKRAGHWRNAQMIEYLLSLYREGCDVGVIALWNGVSRGTRDMIGRARAAGIPVYIDLGAR